VLTHSEHIKTFAEVQSHIEMEEESLKMLGTSHVTFVAKGNRPKSNKNNRGRQAKKGYCLPQNGGLKDGIAKKQKAKGNGGINIAHVKCYNCGRKVTTLGIVLSRRKYFLPLVLLSYMYAPMH